MNQILNFQRIRKQILGIGFVHDKLLKRDLKHDSINNQILEKKIASKYRRPRD